MSVSSALRDEAGVLPRLGENEIAFRRRKAKGLVEIDVDAAPHGHDRRQNMLMVRRLHDHGIDLVAHLVEQVLIRGEAPG